MKNRKRAMVMIFVVMMVLAATTIVAASVDLGRLAIVKQKQSEREAKWQFCVDSAKSVLVENMVGLNGATESFSKTVNNINLSVSSAPNLLWNNSTGTIMTVNGSLEGQTRATNVYLGKRASVQWPQFALYFTDKFQPDANVLTAGDAFLANTVDYTSITLTGDLYSPAITQPAMTGFTGSFYGRQPVGRLAFNDSAYASNANVSTSGTATLTNPTNLLSLTNSQLRYHSGNMTIKGTTTGEITIYVAGNVTISNTKNAVLGILGRLVVICNGDAQIEKGTSEVFLICSGKVTSTSSSGARTINGAISGSELSNTKSAYVINFDNYFNSLLGSGARYWLPGQW